MNPTWKLLRVVPHFSVYFVVISPGKSCQNLLESPGILILNLRGNPGHDTCPTNRYSHWQ